MKRVQTGVVTSLERATLFKNTIKVNVDLDRDAGFATIYVPVEDARKLSLLQQVSITLSDEQ